MMYLKWSAVVLLSIMTAGCGVYSFSGHGIGGISTIAVEPFDNQTAEMGIREDLSDAIVSSLLSNRTLTIAGQANADAILRGTITGFSDNPFTFTENEEVKENRVTITVEIKLIKPGQSEPLWEGRLSGEGSYAYLTGSLDERQQGIDLALEQLVIDLMNRLTSDW